MDALRLITAFAIFLLSAAAVAPAAAHPGLYVNDRDGYAFLVPEGVTTCETALYTHTIPHGVYFSFSPVSCTDLMKNGDGYIGALSGPVTGDPAGHLDELKNDVCEGYPTRETLVGINKFHGFECTILSKEDPPDLLIVLYMYYFDGPDFFISRKVIFSLFQRAGQDPSVLKRFREMVDSFMAEPFAGSILMPVR